MSVPTYSLLALCLLTILPSYPALHLRGQKWNLGSTFEAGRGGVGRGQKWNLGQILGRGGGRQWEDERLDAVIATDEYIEDMQNKIEDLEEIEAEVIEELEDDEDYEGSGNEYPNSIYNM